MKFRRLALLLSLALCLCITLCVTGTVARADCSHRVLCTNMNHCDMCGDEVTEAAEVWHYALCTTDDPTTCACGESDEFKIDHLDPQYDYVFYSDTQCAKMCLACNEPWEVQEHWNYCDNDTTVCYSCDATDVTIELQHSRYNNPYEYDDTTHWEMCTDCNQPIGEPEPHHGRCDGYCYACYATGVTITEENVIYHTGDSEYRSIDETSHVYSCSTCGAAKRDPEPHVVYCDSTEQTCGVCGATDVVVDGVGHKNRQYGSDETYCSAIFCLTCGEMLDEWPTYHNAVCTSPTECYFCGKTDVIIREIWHENTEYSYDDTHHFSHCNDCGEDIGKALHYGDCDAPTTCKDTWHCGATGITIQESELLHDYDSRVTKWDNTHHWTECGLCGKLLSSKYEHTGSCIDPDTCIDCGATGVTLVGIDHEPDYERGNVYVDADTHVMYCALCGEVVWEDGHTVMCDRPGICIICDGTNVNSDPDYGIQHYISVEYNDEEHWSECSRCDYEEGGQPHWDSCSRPGVCVECSAIGVTFEGRTHGYLIEGHDDVKHYATCLECGELSYEGKHYASCTGSDDAADYDTCDGCNATGVTIDHVSHPYSSYEHNETHHWRTCTGGCGLIVGDAGHTVACTADQQDVCEICNASGVTVEIVHGEVNVTYDAINHYTTCADCGKTETNLHWTYCDEDHSVCRYSECGATGLTITEFGHKGSYTPGADGCHFACAYCDETRIIEHVFIDGVCGNCGAEESKRVPGDANEDGRADTLDALLILQHMSGYGVSINLSNADCNADGRADTMDALLILQHMSGYDVELK